MIGELVEDDIANFLSKKDLKKFYNENKSKADISDGSCLLDKSNQFSVEINKIRNIVKLPNKNYNG